MGPNFLECDREQALLLPPSLREWLQEGHLAWFVIDAVERLDLTAFYAAYWMDGQGRAAHEPSMMVALLLYSYAVGERSSRRIERRCTPEVRSAILPIINERRDVVEQALRQRRRSLDALARDNARSLLVSFGQAYDIYDRRFGPTAAMDKTVDHLLRKMRHMRPAGAQVIGENVLAWAREQ